MSKILLYFSITQLLIYFIQSQTIFDYIFRTEFLKKMRECPKCLGFWIALVLFPVFNTGILDFAYSDVLSNSFIYYYYYSIDAFITSVVITFVLWLLVLGWKSVFTITYIK
jgi:hypothetical protein